jgi:3-hydroxyacyl-CoA dehydrogenase
MRLNGAECQPVPRSDIYAMGEAGMSAFRIALHMMKRGGYISEHDEVIGLKIAKILCGGELNHSSYVSEQYLLDLEREGFLSLCGLRKTQERIAAMLKTGKPLRN